MNQSLTNIGTLLSNPHFRYPVIVVILLQVAHIWLTLYNLTTAAEGISSTEKLLLFYLVAAAGNATPQPTKP